MPEHTGASSAEAAPALEQGEKFPAIMSSSSLVPSAGSLLMWLLLSAECKEGFCVGIVAVGFSSALCEAGSAAGVWVKPRESCGELQGNSSSSSWWWLCQRGGPCMGLRSWIWGHSLHLCCQQ